MWGKNDIEYSVPGEAKVPVTPYVEELIKLSWATFRSLQQPQLQTNNSTSETQSIKMQ